MFRRSRIARVACVLAAVAAGPGAAAADEPITVFGMDFGGAARLTAGTESGMDMEAVLTTQMMSVADDRYRGYGIELSYAGNDHLEFFAVLARLEIGMGGPRFNRRSPGRSAHAWQKYIALTGGYGSGSVWDTEYIELYGSEEDVEVAITGVPLYAALGFRRIGGFALRIEAVGGVILVTEQDADLPEGESPSTIPSVGVRATFGIDTFFYTWQY